MKVRIGDLAIAKFDDNEVVCLITGIDYEQTRRHYKLMYWEKTGNTIDINHSELPASRLTRVRPKDCNWSGAIKDLTIDSVIPISEPHNVDKQVILGGCYHDGVAYTTG
jgi:hypothetical protein